MTGRPAAGWRRRARASAARPLCARGWARAGRCRGREPPAAARRATGRAAAPLQRPTGRAMRIWSGLQGSGLRTGRWLYDMYLHCWCVTLACRCHRIHPGSLACPRCKCATRICRTMSCSSQARTKLHAQHLLPGGGVDERALLAALQVHAVRLKVLQQQLPHPQSCLRQQVCPANARLRFVAASAAVVAAWRWRAAGCAAHRAAAGAAQELRDAAGAAACRGLWPAGSAVPDSGCHGVIQPLVHVQVRQEACSVGIWSSDAGMWSTAEIQDGTCA